MVPEDLIVLFLLEDLIFLKLLDSLKDQLNLIFQYILYTLLDLVGLEVLLVHLFH